MYFHSDINIKKCCHYDAIIYLLGDNVYNVNKNDIKFTISAIRGSSGLGSAMSS